MGVAGRLQKRLGGGLRPAYDGGTPVFADGCFCSGWHERISHHLREFAMSSRHIHIEALVAEANEAIACLACVPPAKHAELVPVGLAEKFNTFHDRLLALNPDLSVSMPKKIPFAGTGASRMPVINHIELRVFWKQALRAIPARRPRVFHPGPAPDQMAETKFKESFF
jgi:hypothetical protein